MDCLKRLWRDEAGFLATSDLILISVILVLGTIVGLVTLRDQVVQELADVAQAIAALNQSYTFEGDNDGDLPGTPPNGEPDNPAECFVAGSTFEDATDAGQDPDGVDQPGAEPYGIDVSSTMGDDEDTPLP